MMLHVPPQDLVNRYREDAAVWQAWQRRRAGRGQRPRGCAWSEELLDRLDWQAAEREIRQVAAIGSYLTRRKP